MEYKVSNEPGFISGLNIWEEEIKDPISQKDKYFESYSHYAIHEEMIKDKVRTRAYKDAILRNKYLFRNKTVLDVGCGTGILSFFSLQAGAKHVYAVDSANIIDYAVKIAEQNHMKNITFIKGKIEEIELPVKYVDIIISE